MDEFTYEHVEKAAYHRWERRGWSHGRHDDDWLAAETALRFGRLYEVVSSHGLHSRPHEPAPNGGMRRVCRFCEQAEPRTRFGPPAPAGLGPLAEAGPLSWDQCEECRDRAEADLSPALIALHDRLPEWWAAPESLSISIAAAKALTRTALAILPPPILDEFPDACEWVENPDHDGDPSILGALVGARVFLGPGACHAPWSAIARRKRDDEDYPSTLFFASSRGTTWLLPIPLGSRDEEIEPGAMLPPPPLATPLDPLADLGPTRSSLLVVERPKPRMRPARPVTVAAERGSLVGSFLSKLFS